MLSTYKILLKIGNIKLCGNLNIAYCLSITIVKIVNVKNIMMSHFDIIKKVIDCFHVCQSIFLNRDGSKLHSKETYYA